MEKALFVVRNENWLMLFYGAKLTGENIVDVGVSPATAPEKQLMAS
jgi:hypothetical protein